MFLFVRKKELLVLRVQMHACTNSCSCEALYQVISWKLPVVSGLHVCSPSPQSCWLLEFRPVSVTKPTQSQEVSAWMSETFPTNSGVIYIFACFPEIILQLRCFPSSSVNRERRPSTPMPIELGMSTIFVAWSVLAAWVIEEFCTFIIST